MLRFKWNYSNRRQESLTFFQINLIPMIACQFMHKSMHSSYYRIQLDGITYEETKINQN